MPPVAGPVVGDGFVHTALLYRHEAEFLSDVSRFVRAAVTRGEPVLVAVPGRRVKPLRLTLGAAAGEVRFVDITQAGRNPGRMISVVRAFAEVHLGQRVSVVGEPAWPDRSSPELVEVAIHEALSNLAFAGVPLTALCPYEVAALPPEALERARQTHPLLAWPGRERANPAYLGPGQLPPPCREPLPEPPPGTETLHFGNDLQPVRALIRRRATLLSLPPDRAADLVIAVSELAANTVRPPGTSALCGYGKTAMNLSVKSLTRATSPTRWRAGGARPPISPAGTACGWSMRCAIWWSCGPGRTALPSGST